VEADFSKVYIYDTTLRDGTQGIGMSLSVEDKIRIAHKLDQLGVPFIEGGWPGANPKDVQFFLEIKERPLNTAQVVAFCSTRRPGIQAQDDPMLRTILAAGTQWVTLFGKSWDLHVTEGLGTTLEENLAMIGDTITFLKSQGRRVIYDAEHWFDGFLHNRAYALATLKQARDAGAEWLVLCDTNGGMLPHQVQKIVQQVVQELGQETGLGIHTHNDSETAVANALVAIQAGARMVHGTMNGYGERCGNANLCSVIPNLQLKLGYSCLPEGKLAHLTETSLFISETVNVIPQEQAPFVGAAAFAHKGGIHVSAVQKNPLTYEHIEPKSVGNRRRILVSEQAGGSNILAKAAEFGLTLKKTDPRVKAILYKLKELEHAGYQFEGADASFELLVREHLDYREPFFILEGFHASSQTFPDGSVRAEATVKVRVDGVLQHTAAEGNGPVSALDEALRKALVQFFPQIGQFQLTDYKVRILDGGAGTEAKTRVLVESSNGQERWTTVGVSTNIIEASYIAVVEGLEYGLLLSKKVSPQQGASIPMRSWEAAPQE
jgi:2-isopropylmalate synthase